MLALNQTLKSTHPYCRICLINLNTRVQRLEKELDDDIMSELGEEALLDEVGFGVYRKRGHGAGGGEHTHFLLASVI